jgi:3-deoxy-D-manno-octulosonic-acid transferase
MSDLPPGYQLAIGAMRGLVAAAAPFSGRARAASAGRADTWRRLAAWRRPPGRLVLFHASSAGEARQTEAVLRRLRDLQPSATFAFTWFSPSATPTAESIPADFRGFLPWDGAADIARFLDALAPDLIVVTKLDVWPQLVLSSSVRRIPLALVAAAVRPGSSRLRWPAREATRRIYAAFDLIAAVSAEDAGRLTTLGARPARQVVTGDPRVDSVLDRLAGTPPPDLPPGAGRPGPTLVAGSTWPRDEAVLLDAWAIVRQVRPEARLVLVPHRPEAGTRARLARAASRRGVPPPSVSGSAEAPLTVIDRVGSLAWAYGSGTLAYVGGGFGRAGLHSVLEPAAWGIPVVTGPRYRESRDAAILARSGGLVPVGSVGGSAASELAEIWSRLLARADEREARGLAARRLVDEERGAADRTAALLEPYLAVGGVPTITPS